MRRARGSLTGRGSLSFVLLTVAVAVAYVVGARIGLGLAALIEDQVTPLWPPTGVAVAALILAGRRAVAGIALGALLVNAPLGPSAAAVALIVAGNTAAPVLAFAALRAFRFDARFIAPRDALTLVIVASGAMMLSATAGSGALLWAGAISPDAWNTTWWIWWVGDATGVLVFAPLLIVWLSPAGEAPKWSPARLVEATALNGAIVVASSSAFRGGHQVRFVIFPLLILVAWRFEHRIAVLAGAFGALGAAHSAAVSTTGSTMFADMVELEAFAAAVMATALVVSAWTAERRRTASELAHAHATLEDRVRARTEELRDANDSLIESKARLSEAQRVARIGSWEWGVASNKIVWSDEMYRLAGLTPGTPVGFETYLNSVHPDEREMVRDLVAKALEDHRSFSFEHRTLRPDGSVTWVYCEGHVALDASGKPVSLRGICQDISERREAAAAARRIQEQEQRHRQALQLNDEVIQGLSIAAYSLEAGDLERAGRAVAATLDASRHIVGDLLAWDPDGVPVGGDLVRDDAAEVYRLPRARPAADHRRKTAN